MIEIERNIGEDSEVHFVDNGKIGNEIKKSKSEKMRDKTIAGIMIESFMVRMDKEGKIKPAKVTKADLKLLVSIGVQENLSAEVMEEICRNAEKTDPQLDCLAEIVLEIVEAGNRDGLRALFDSCVRIASGVWINKHLESFDLFRDIFDGQYEVKDYLQYLDETLIKMYEKRSSATRSGGEDRPKNCGSDKILEQSPPEIIPIDSGNHPEKKALERQKNNLFIIGSFWLIEQKLLSYPSLIDFLIGKIDTRSSCKASLIGVAVYLSHQRINPDVRLFWILSRYQQEIDGITKKNDELNRQIIHDDRNISSLKQQLSRQISISESAECKIENLKSDVASLNARLEEQQLDEKARRTHLRDSEGQVRARAVNLLSEEVLEPLRLSLAALQREIPKSEVAAHHVELVIESIERELKWFKE